MAATKEHHSLPAREKYNPMHVFDIIRNQFVGTVLAFALHYVGLEKILAELLPHWASDPQFSQTAIVCSVGLVIGTCHACKRRVHMVCRDAMSLVPSVLLDGLLLTNGLGLLSSMVNAARSKFDVHWPFHMLNKGDAHAIECVSCSTKPVFGSIHGTSLD